MIKEVVSCVLNMLMELFLESIEVFAEIFVGIIVLYWIINHFLTQLAVQFGGGSDFMKVKEVILTIVVVLVVVRGFIKFLKLFNQFYKERILKEESFNILERFSMRFITLSSTLLVFVIVLNYFYLPLFMAFVESFKIASEM